MTRLRHSRTGLGRNFLSDNIPDISTLALEDSEHYYLNVSSNRRTFETRTDCLP